MRARDALDQRIPYRFHDQTSPDDDATAFWLAARIFHTGWSEEPILAWVTTGARLSDHPFFHRCLWLHRRQEPMFLTPQSTSQGGETA